MGNDIPQYLITNSSLDTSSTLDVTVGIPSIQSANQTPTLDELIRALCIMTALLVPNPNASYTNAVDTYAVDNTSQPH